VRALLRFHWRAGARVALRANGIIGAAVVFLYGLQDDAPTRIRSTTLDLIARHSGWNARLKLTGICLALAGVAMPRVTLGATGWMRSLAVSASASRRAAIIALAATQLFAIILGTAALVAAATVYHAPIDAGKLIGLPLIIVAASAVMLPVERKAGAVFAAIALIAAVPGHLVLDGISIAALVAADRTAGAIARWRGVPVHRWSSAWVRASPIAQWVRLTLRTISFATSIGVLLAPTIFVAFAYFILRNNPDLGADLAHRTVRICGTLAECALAAALASSIVRTRPAWAWIRSLPWSARQRVLGDLVMHATALFMIPLVLVPLDAANAGAVALLAIPLGAVSAAAIRAGAGRQTSAAGEIACAALVYGTLLALWPMSGVISLCTTPLLLRAAEGRERNAIVTRWDELHHDAAGDPAWTSAA